MAWVCPICEGSTWVFDDSGEVVACSCRAETVRRARTRGLTTTIPKRYAGISVSDDGQTVTNAGRPMNFRPEITRVVLRYIREVDERIAKGRGLWFSGDTGTGKTTLAMLVSKAAVRAGHSVAIYSVPRLLAEIRSTFDDGSSHSYEQLFAKLTTVDLLHLDDVGAEQQTEWVLEQLYSIVNERYEDGRAITITTNLIGEELANQIGERTVSRLVEICGDPLELRGRDRRIDPFESDADEPSVERTIG